MGGFDITLTLLGTALAVCLAVLLVLRKLFRSFSFFFCFVVFSIAVAIAGLSVSGNYHVYFNVYWTTEAMQAVMALLALHEAFRHVFSVEREDWPWFGMVFPGAVVILSVFFIGNAILHPPHQERMIVAVILSFGTVVNCVEGGLFILLLLLACLLLSKGWPTFPYGVVFGFGVSALGSVVSFWAVSVFGTRFNLLGKYGPPVAYILAVLIWIGSCFLPPEPKNRWAGMSDPEQALATIKEYLKALKWIAGRR
jgi:hypothetical protein